MTAATDTQILWQQTGENLRTFIRKRVRGPDDADDILQEVFARIHATRDRLPEVRNVSGWIHRIAINVINDHHRARSREAALLDRVAGEGSPEQAADPVGEPDPDLLPRAGRELARCIEPLLARLPEPYREALRLTEIEGLTQREAAERLGLSLSGLKSRVQRGRDQLREVVLDCCSVEMDARGRVIDYSRRPGGCPGPCQG